MDNCSPLSERLAPNQIVIRYEMLFIPIYCYTPTFSTFHRLCYWLTSQWSWRMPNILVWRDQINSLFWNWVVPEKIHTPSTDGILEILAGGGVEDSGNPRGRGGVDFFLNNPMIWNNISNHYILLCKIWNIIKYSSRLRQYYYWVKVL